MRRAQRTILTATRRWLVMLSVGGCSIYASGRHGEEMVMPSAHDVAAYILQKQGRMSTMKLQKLCYYSQGWSLAWDGEPLFDDEISAWANGPVIYNLFDEHRGRFTVEDWPRGDVRLLDSDQRETIDAVLASYGDLTGQQLSDKTHEERPWLEAREGLQPGARSQRPVDLDVMQDFFGGLDQLN